MPGRPRRRSHGSQAAPHGHGLDHHQRHIALPASGRRSRKADDPLPIDGVYLAARLDRQVEGDVRTFRQDWNR